MAAPKQQFGSSFLKSCDIHVVTCSPLTVLTVSSQTYNFSWRTQTGVWTNVGFASGPVQGPLCQCSIFKDWVILINFSLLMLTLSLVLWHAGNYYRHHNLHNRLQESSFSYRIVITKYFAKREDWFLSSIIDWNSIQTVRPIHCHNKGRMNTVHVQLAARLSRHQPRVLPDQSVSRPASGRLPPEYYRINQWAGRHPAGFLPAGRCGWRQR